MSTVSAGRVVAGFAEDRTSRAALDWAGQEARRRNAELHLVRVVATRAPDEFTAEAPGRAFSAQVELHAHEALEQAAIDVRRRVPAVRVTTSVRHGAPRRVLVEESRTADLLVVGSRAHREGRSSRGGTAPRGELFTSRSDHLATHAACPVVVVDEGAHEGSGVVVGDDGSDSSRSAVRFAADEARLMDEPLTIVRAWWFPQDPFDPTADGSARHGSGQAALEGALTAAAQEVRAEFGEVVVDWRLVRADPPWIALLDGASTPRLVVVGSRGRSAATSSILGSTSRAVLHALPGPVAVVPAGCVVRTAGARRAHPV